jgi:hypothetical protein
MHSVPRSLVSASIDQLKAPTSPRRRRTEPPVTRTSNSKLLPETYQDGGEGVCLEFTTSSPTTSTQPAPPVSSRMVRTAHAYHAFPKHTKPPKLDSAKSPKAQGARFSASSNSLSVLLSSWAVLPCRSLDANTVQYCAKARHSNHHPCHFDAAVLAPPNHPICGLQHLGNRRI